MSYHEYLVSTYIADRHREAVHRRLARGTRDGSREVIQRTKLTLPHWVRT